LFTFELLNILIDTFIITQQMPDLDNV